MRLQKLVVFSVLSLGLWVISGCDSSSEPRTAVTSEDEIAEYERMLNESGEGQEDLAPE